jgi:flagellar motility protein MotE (MotC chaperone)
MMKFAKPALLAIGVFAAAGGAMAQTPAGGVRNVMPAPPYATGSGPPPAAAVEVEAEVETLVVPGDAVDANAAQYCESVADAAADARFVRQAKALREMEAQLEERIAALEEKRAEYEAWLKRREDFLEKADEAIVAIYSQMRPDAAAQQVAVMDPGAAAAILSKLNPRTASAILNEMDPDTAALLTNTIGALAKKPAPKEPQG